MCSVSIVSFYYLSSFSSVSPFLTPTLFCIRFSLSVLFQSFLDFRVQYQHLSFPCFPFIALASIILQRSRSTFPVPIPCRLQRFQSRECNRSGRPTFPGSSRPRFHRAGRDRTCDSRF